MRHHCTSTALATLTMLVAGPVTGADRTFIGPGTSWQNADSWSPTGVPGSGDDVTIALFNFTVGLDWNTNVLSSLRVANAAKLRTDSYRVTVAGGPTVVEGDGSQIIVFGAGGDPGLYVGDIELSDGGWLAFSGGLADVTGEAHILTGGKIGGSGTLRVHGTGETNFTNRGRIQVIGSLRIESTSSAELQLAVGGQGIVLVQEDAELILDGPVAPYSGHMTVLDDGILNVLEPWRTTATSTISLLRGARVQGALFESRGELQVTDGSAYLDAPVHFLAGGITRIHPDTHLSLGVAAVGDGIFSFTGGRLDGATLTNNYVVQGDGVVATEDLAGPGLVRGRNGTLTIDVGAQPAFLLDADAELEAAVGNVDLIGMGAAGPEISATVTVADRHFLRVGGQAMNLMPDARLILDGGRVFTGGVQQSPGGSTIEVLPGAESLIDSTVETRFSETVELDGDLRVRGSTLLEDGANVAGSGRLIIDEGSTLHTQHATALGASLVNEGMLSFFGMEQTGSFTVTGAFEQTSTGRLQMDVGQPSGRDLFLIFGTATAGGHLQVDAPAGYEIPAEGLNLISTTAGVSGYFETFDLPSGVALAYDATDIILVPDDCPADLDGTRDVDVADLVTVLGSWGDTGGPADLDESGSVEVGDLIIVLAAWGPCE
jgi:hypothetical protein